MLTLVDRPRFADREQLPLPTRPPFTAHLGNLAYDVTQTDIEDFLRDCHTTSIRIVEDKLDRKPKGFGYVEFATLDGLKIALTKTESNFMGRNIKISVAEPCESYYPQSIVCSHPSVLTSFRSQRSRRIQPRPVRLVAQRPPPGTAPKYPPAVQSRVQPKLRQHVRRGQRARRHPPICLL